MQKEVYRGKVWNVQFIARWGSFWVGCHYSSRYQSYCIALIPCVVFRIGKTEYIADPGCGDKCG